MKGYLYILKCVDDSYYTGSTKDISRRIKQHQDGEGARHTAKRLPVELIYVEVFDRIDAAFQREKQIQGWSRKKKEALMMSDFNQLHELAECGNDTHHRFVGDGFGSVVPEPFGYAQEPRSRRAQPAVEGVPVGDGFGSAQPTVEGVPVGDGFGSAQPAVEGVPVVEKDSTTRSLSGAEGNMK